MEKTSTMSETDFTWERKPHPMCIPHIVDNILNNLKVQDLKICRLVSSQYNEIACKTLQREETIVFKSIPQLETYVSKIKPISLRCRGCSSSISLCSELSSLPADEYVEETTADDEKNGSEDEECWPYFENETQSDDSLSGSHSHEEDYCYYNSQYYYSHRSFHFDYCDPPTDLETVDHFFRKFGQQIQRLKYTTDLLPYNFPRLLGHMGDVWQDRLKNLEELILEMKWGVPAHLFGDRNENRVLLPTLRKLNLDVLLTDTDANRAHTFFQELLSVTPNLEEISIPGSKRFFDDYINCVLTQVIISSELPQLSILNFCLALSDAQMRLLTTRNFPLSTLILDLIDVEIQDEDQIHPQNNGDNNGEDGNGNGDEDLEFLRQNPNRRSSFTPITKTTLQRFMNSVAGSLESLHVCFPQSPRHNLHTFTFTSEMTELKFLAVGYYAGSSHILDNLPALKKLELWNVQFQDCHGIGKVVPDKYQQLTSVIT